MAADKFVKFLKDAAGSSKAGYLTWRMLLKCYWYLLNSYGNQYDNYIKVSNEIYTWLAVPDMNITYAAVDDMAIEDR